MHGGHHNRRERRRNGLAALHGDAEVASEQRLRSRRSETHERFRFDDREFLVYPLTARVNLALPWLLVNAPLPTRLPLEMLHDVGDVDDLPIDSRLLERAVEQLARRSHEGMAVQIFFVSWLLTDEHDLRALRTFAEDGLRRVLPQIAVAAALGFLADR